MNKCQLQVVEDAVDDGIVGDEGDDVPVCVDTQAGIWPWHLGEAQGLIIN